MEQRQQLEQGLKRDISKLGYSALAINSVIGAGIFGLPAVAAARTGHFSPWMFVICAVLTLTIVASFARAASLTRETGGVLMYASHAFGPFAGFQTGWLAYLSRVAAMGANTNLLVTYMAWFWAPLDSDPWRSLALTAIIGSLTWLNVVGVRNGMVAMYVVTVLKLLPLSLLVLFGLGKIDPGQLFGADIPALGSMGETILILLYAYVGFEGAVVTAGEGRNPRRDLPSALIRTTLIIAIIYVLVQAVSVAVLPDLASSTTALADVAAVLFGPLGATVLTLGALFSIGGNLMSSVLSAPRMTWALARDGSLPPWFAQLHPRYATPHRSIVFYGAISLALAISGSFIWLAAMSTVVRLITYMVCIAALPRLAHLSEPGHSGLRLPGGMLIPVIGLLVCLWLIAQASLRSWLVMTVFFALGSALYALSRRRPTPTPGA
jgi:amino acid transporter